jgi:hypothetical protein
MGQPWGNHGTHTRYSPDKHRATKPHLRGNHATGTVAIPLSPCMTLARERGPSQHPGPARSGLLPWHNQKGRGQWRRFVLTPIWSPSRTNMRSDPSRKAWLSARGASKGVGRGSEAESWSILMHRGGGGLLTGWAQRRTPLLAEPIYGLTRPTSYMSHLI